MNNIYKQYAVIRNNWTPNNPIRAFEPFIHEFIRLKHPEKVTLEEISKQLDEIFGLHLTYYLLRSILEALRSKGEASLTEGTYWDFNIKNEKLSDAALANIDEKEVTNFVDGFITFVGGNISREYAESLINSFFSRYDYEVLNGQIVSMNSKSFDNYDYYVAEYVKSLFANNTEELSFVEKVAQGSIIKSAMCNENLNLTVFNNKNFYFDTKILFRLLGYYGEYYEGEYATLINELHTQKANLYITEYVYNEALSILRGCEKYIDSADYQYEKASDVLRYFRSIKLTKSEIQEKISTFEETLLSRFHIRLDKTNVFNGQQDIYNENYSRIKGIIVEKYGYTNDEFRYIYENGVETDINSILHAYLKRANNDIVLIKDSPLFFITTNGALVKSVMQYHAEVYGKKLSPIMSDTFLGVLLYKTTKNLATYSKIKLLTFCNEAYRPTQEQRRKFIECVEKAEQEKNLTPDQTFLIKHYELIDDVLVQQLRAKDFNINDDCVYDALTEIQHALVKDVSESYERKLSSERISHEKIISNKQKKHEEEIAATCASYEERLNATTEQFKNYKKKQFDEEFSKYKKRVSVVYFIISAVILCAAVFVIIIPFIFGKGMRWYDWLYTIPSAILGFVDSVTLIKTIKNKEPLNVFIKRKEEDLKKKYEIS